MAQVCPYSLSPVGGVQEQVMVLTRALRRSGHDVVIIAPCDGPPPVGGVRSVGRSVGVGANGSVSPVALWPTGSGRTVRELDLLACRGLDVVHIHEPLTPSVSTAALGWSGAPKVGTFHRSGASGPYRLAARAARRAVAGLGGSFAVSAEAASTAAAVFGFDCPILPNGIDLDVFSGASPGAPQGDDLPVVLFLGRHERRKGLPVLLEAFDQLERQGFRGQLWVAGDGPLTGRLQARFSHLRRVVWLGRVGARQKVRVLQSADVLCAPSLGGESFGIVLAEAMAAGTTVVASDIAGYRSVARSAAEAVLVPPGRADLLADALDAVTKSPSLRRELADAGLRRAKSLSIELLAAEYVRAYESAALAWRG